MQLKIYSIKLVFLYGPTLKCAFFFEYSAKQYKFSRSFSRISKSFSNETKVEY